MTKIIAVINQKGGVGKTSTACHLAYSFAEQKNSTLLIDLDPSANATGLFLESDSKLTIKEFLTDKNFNVLCISPTFSAENPIDYLSIIPSCIGLAMLEMELGNRPFKEMLLKKKTDNPIMQEFDYIVIDCPPTLTTLTINGMYAADFILVPVNYQKNALEGVADLFTVLEEIKEGHIYDMRLLRNQYDGRKKTINAFVAEKLHPLITQGLVLNTIIRQDEAINRSTLENMTVFDYCPHTTAKPDYVLLRTELEEIFKNG